MSALIPLGSRVLVRPTPPDTASESGIVFPETHTPRSAVSGTVIRVGHGPASAHTVRAQTIARCRQMLTEAIAYEEGFRATPDPAADTALAALTAYAARAASLSELQPGDFVTFPFTAGTVLEVDGEALLILDEAEITARWREGEDA